MEKISMYSATVLVMIILLVFMALNAWVVPMSDWVVRVVGIVMLIDLAVLVFLFVRTNEVTNSKKGA